MRMCQWLLQTIRQNGLSREMKGSEQKRYRFGSKRKANNFFKFSIPYFSQHTIKRYGYSKQLSLVYIWTFYLLLLFWVFRTNKKPKRATKSQNEQPKAFACFGFWDRTRCLRASRTRTRNENQQKAKKGQLKHAPKPISIYSLQFWTNRRWLISKTMKMQ